jgi:hypothetical protein
MSRTPVHHAPPKHPGSSCRKPVKGAGKTSAILDQAHVEIT